MKQTNKLTNQRIALVHDYLNEAGGAERVLRVLSEMYPSASIYTAFAKKNGSAYITLQECDIRESKWAWFLKIGRFYSYFRFLLPFIWRSIDLREYDLVITSTSGGYIARGFRVGPTTKVVAYCHTPPKWLYGYETPTGAGGKWWGRVFMWVMGPFLRYFDFTSAQRVDLWIANSKEVAGRINKFYRKGAVVVYPPIEIPDSRIMNHDSGVGQSYYLLVTRVTGAKGVMEAVEAARQSGFHLKVAGEVVEQRMKKQLERVGENIEVLGRVDEARLSQLYRGAKGFIALARDEDFGMTVVECMAHGTPVLALNEGGYKETVIDSDNQKTCLRRQARNTQKVGKSAKSANQRLVQTGVLINDTDTESVKAGIARMEKTKWDREGIKKWASTFGRERFEKDITKLVNKLTN